MIPRVALTQAVGEALADSPVVVLLGPRQCGKTTLGRMVARGRRTSRFDMEDPTDRARLDSPKSALERLEGLVVIDEIQRRPELFEILRVLVDRPSCPGRFLLMGSASPHIVRGASETLAGRAAFVRMGGFDLSEVGGVEFRRLWTRGGFPRSYLARSDPASLRWRNDFVTTFLERDVPQLGISIPTEALRRFWMMIAHLHGQVFNAAELARSLGSSEGTARRYLDLLSGALVVRQLQPWFENVGKRQVKAPKVYVRDSGILHALLAIPTHERLLGHPKYGASFEGFALEQVLSLLHPPDAYFWATHGGAELDLFLLLGGRRLGFEFKCSDAPRVTPSMRIAVGDLGLDHLYVLYPGADSYALDDRVDVVAIREVIELRRRLRGPGSPGRRRALRRPPGPPSAARARID